MEIYRPRKSTIFAGSSLLYSRSKKGLLAPAVDEGLRQAEIALVTRAQRKLHEREFDALVPGLPLASAGAERSLEAVCVLDGDIEEHALPGGFKVGHSGLKEVAGVEVLVAEGEISPAPGGDPRAGSRCRDSRLPAARRR